MRLYLAKACESINISAMVPGQFRHSLVSIGQDGRMVAPMGGGLSLQDLTEITGHKSTATAKRFYDNQAVPRMFVLPLDLKHPTTLCRLQRSSTSLEACPTGKMLCGVAP